MDTKKSFSRLIFAVLMTIALIVPLTISAITVYAADPVTLTITDIGQSQWIDAHTQVTLTKKNYSTTTNKLVSYEYTAIITGAPQITSNGIRIDPTWQSKKDASGATYFTAGNNTFMAIATANGRISLQDTKGALNVWNPTVMVGLTKFTLSSDVKIVNDTFNKSYHNNTLQFTYTAELGNIIIKKPTTIIRELRLIEGSIQEVYYVLNNPGDDLTVRYNTTADSVTQFTRTSAVAWDQTKHTNFLAVTNHVNSFIITADQFNNKTYPIIIDPTSTYTGSTYDAWLNDYNVTYNTAWADVSAALVIDGTYPMWVGQELSFGSYQINRSAVSFDTSAIPDTSTITSAYISLNAYSVLNDNSFYVTVQNGQPSYPSQPVQTGDYSKSLYSSNGGSISSNNLLMYGYANLNLNATGLTWINKTGTTRLMLRTDHDIAGTTPINREDVGFYQAEYGTGMAPTMTVTYTAPISTPTITTSAATDIQVSSATLNGVVSNSGGENNVVGFNYGTTTSYGSTTTTLSGKTTGDSFSIPIGGLTHGATYHFRAFGTNSAGTGNGLDQTFTTLPDPPTSFTATAGNQQNVLSWTKGTGATNTIVRSSTTTYPTSITDGTSVYASTGSGVTDTPLTQGTTYYYSAWSNTGAGYSTRVTTSATPYYTGAPVTTTRDATDVTTTAATLNGYLDAINQVGGDVTVSFQYYTDPGGYSDNSAAAGTLTSPGSFTADISGLANGTLYHYRTKAVGTNGTGYGSDKTFTTGSLYSATVDTTSATGLGMTYATLNGIITDDGGASCTVYFKYGLASNALNNTTTSSTGLYETIPFYYNLTGLALNTTYYYQAVAQNSVGTGFGDIVSFTTANAAAPTITTNTAQVIGSNTATLSGTVTYDGGVDSEVQFEWDVDTGSPYANSTGWQTLKRTSDTVTAIISGLVVGTDYYYRASIKNANTTAYGSEQTFTTVFLEPGDFTVKATGATTLSLSWTPQGDQTYIVYKITGYPIDRLDGIQAYFGSASSFTHSSLTAGTTYFYRAWSWRTGDVWSTDYSEDVATTGGTYTTADSVNLTNITNPDVPTEMFQEPSTTKIQGIEFWYDAIKTFATQEGTSESTSSMWLAIGPTIGVAVFVGIIASSAALGLGIMAAAILVFSLMGVIPMWWLIMDGILGILYILVFGKGGQ